MEEEFRCSDEIKGNRTKAVKRMKQKCRQMMLINEAYGQLIATYFPGHIRLSIHPHSNVHKFGINLIGKNVQSCGSPWHNVAVYSMVKARWETIKKSSAEEKGFEIARDTNDLLYYTDGAL